MGKGEVDADEELKDEKSEIQQYADDGSSPHTTINLNKK